MSGITLSSMQRLDEKLQQIYPNIYLDEAIKDGNIQGVRQALLSGANLNPPINNIQLTPLMQAVDRDNRLLSKLKF